MIPSDSKSTRLFLIRHGEVVKDGYCNGHLDVSLTEKGRGQMDRLAEEISGVEVHAVYSSDLKRTIYGAERIASMHGLKPEAKPELREKSFGHWEGLPLVEIQDRFAGEWRDWRDRPDTARPAGGETYQEVEQRVMPVIDGILNRHAGECVVIVAHGGVNRVVLCRALGLDLSHLFRIEQYYAAVNLIESSSHRFNVHLVNGGSAGAGRP